MAGTSSKSNKLFNISEMMKKYMHMSEPELRKLILGTPSTLAPGGYNTKAAMQSAYNKKFPDGPLGYKKKKDELTNDEIFALATIAGESIGENNEKAYSAIACVMKNRSGVREWKKYDNFKDLCEGSGFDACMNGGNKPFKEADKYLQNRDGTNKKMEKLIEAALPYLRGEKKDFTNNAVLYYSPKSMSKEKSEPSWNFDILDEISISDIDNDAFRWFAYK